MKMTSWHSRAHTHTLTEHMGRTHQIIIFIQIQNNQKLLLPIHTVKIHICNTHTTHTCVNKVYSKCFGIFAYVHEPVCMRCIQNYSVDSFVSTAANKLCWMLGFGWMLFFHSASLCDLINSSSVYRGTYFLFVPAVYFCCFE